MRRRFIDATQEERCKWDVTLRDKSHAQCGRRKTCGDYCTQHATMAAAQLTLARMAERAQEFDCESCGGNDETPPDHCMDCSRQTGA